MARCLQRKTGPVHIIEPTRAMSIITLRNPLLHITLQQKKVIRLSHATIPRTQPQMPT